MTDFVHLHLHTEYSLLDGAVKCGELMDHCVKNGIKAVAITDHGNMYATLKFAEEAKKRGVKYIIGCEFYCCRDYTQKDARHSEFDHLILLAKNKTGYRNLVQLDSIAFVDGFYYKPRIDYKTLKEHSEGVICLSACLAGRIPRLLMQGDYEGAKAFALELQSVFGEDFYIEIQDHGIPEQKMTNPLLVQIAREIGAEIVATNDVHYLRQEDWEMQDVLLCIQTKKTLDDPKRMKFQTQEFYMKTGDQMAELFPQWPEAIENTVKIADKIEEEVFPLNAKGYPIRDVSLIPMYSPGDEFRAIPLECLRFFEVEGYETGEYFKKLIANGLVREAANGSLSSEYEFFTYNSDELAEAFQKTALWLDNKPGYARTLPAHYESYWAHAGELADYFKSLSSVKPKTVGVIKKGTGKAKKVILDGFIQDVFFLDRDANPVFCYDNRLQPGVAYPYSQIKEIGYDSKGYLRWLCENGLHKRYKEITETIRKRADYELSIICGMGYADYYLIVWDYINWSKEHGIPVGPGRGSGVSSIVAYSIGITDVEPLQYSLLFERFLNPDRVSMPDFDVDFCTDRRQESIEYVRKKYYSQNVAQIVTFGTMASKAAIKDTGRVMRVPYSETDRVAKLMDGKSSISDLLGRNIEKLEKKIEAEENEDKRAELMKALEETRAKRNPEFIEVYETDETLRKVIDMALRIEGMPRNTSMHAAGVVICQKRIADHVPLSRNGEDVTTQFNMKEIEALGMLKMDFLALTTLTDIKKSCDYIRENYGVELDFNELGYDDLNVYRMISEGATDGVFQLEQGGMKKFMRDLKPDRLEDLIAGISLYRPGPMKDIPRYCENKNHPDRITYDTPLLEPILNVTYGVPIYQEQVMNIFQSLAGFSLGQADLVRRAMGKKDKNTLMAQKESFIHGNIGTGGNIVGCVANGVPAEIASKIFENMESFASYAFNKSHAAAYAVVSYQTAYIKCYYIKEFIAGLLNNRITKSDEITKYSAYMKEQGIPVLPPDINYSKAEFSVEGRDGGVRFGLCALKGVGRAAVDAVIEERETKGKFTSFTNFLMRCTKYVNKRIVESLIYGGAFDAFGHTRATLAAVYGEAMDRIVGINKQQAGGQLCFFGDVIEEREIEIVYPQLEEFELNEKLAKEKLVLGVYVSGHPFEKYKDSFRDATFNCSLLQEYTEEEADEEGETVRVYENVQDGQIVTMGGIISEFKKHSTQSGSFMAFLSVEDMYGSIECVAFPKIYEKIRSFAAIDVVVRLKGKLDITPGKNPVIILEDMKEYTEEATRPAPAKRAEKSASASSGILWLNANELDDQDIEELMEMLDSYHGNTEVRIVRGGKKFRITQGVELSRAFQEELKAYFPDPACIKFIG